MSDITMRDVYRALHANGYYFEAEHADEVREAMDRVAALADLDAHDTPLIIAHHLQTEWVRWDDVRDLIRSTLNPEAGAPAATTGDDADRLPASAPASVTTPTEPTRKEEA